MLEDNLGLPFETEILGFKVTVERVDMTEDDAIVAICKRGSKRQRVSILDLPLPWPPPEGDCWAPWAPAVAGVPARPPSTRRRR